MKRKAYSLLVIALAATGCGAAVDNPEPAAESEPRDLEALNQELSMTSLDEAVQNRWHFRSLCDDEGYPLVGNLNGKVITTASEFCEALRDSDLL